MKRFEHQARGRFDAARRIILQCLFWYLLAAGFFTAFESAIVSAKVDKEIAGRIIEIKARVTPALELALWNLDYDLVSLILEGAVDDLAIRRVELRDEAGTMVAALDTAGEESPTLSDNNSPRTFPLFHISQGKSIRPIGELTLFPSPELRMERMRDTLFFSMERTALLVLILSIILAIAIEGGLGRPLREFAKRISEVDPTDPGKSPPIVLRRAKSGELALVAESFNSMAEKMGETMTALSESRARLWSAFEDSPISLWEEDFSGVKRRVDEETVKGVHDWHAYFEPVERVIEFRRLIKIIDVNQSTIALLGARDKRQVLGPLFDAIGDQAIVALRMELVALAYGALSWEGESVHVAKEGKSIILQIRLRIVPGHEETWDRVLLSMVDVTEQKRAEKVLRQSLTEKELLLKEVHHRVKNNLQIICSLISIQSGAVDPDSETALSLADIESRVWSMALVHELLYENQDFAALDFPGYVERLCDRITSSYADDPERISVAVDIQDNVRLVLEKAIPCGLLINELVVNSFKHAFPDGRKGTIRVSMERSSGGDLRLLVGDDGIGVGDLSKLKKSKSIGVVLIENLAKQLGGSITFRGNGGFQAELWFPDSFEV